MIKANSVIVNEYRCKFIHLQKPDMHMRFNHHRLKRAISSTKKPTRQNTTIYFCNYMQSSK